MDDNLDSVHTMALLLKHLGHEVRFAINGGAAMLVARSLKPEFVFLDLGLPDMDGCQVARALKSEFGDTVRIIAVTGRDSAEDRARSAQAGCERHLAKPADLGLIQTLLG